METAELISPDWWTSDSLEIAENPRAPVAMNGLREFLTIRDVSGIIVPTSGSEGAGPKFVALARNALLASARSVNRHLEASSGDRWLCALPTFHVGGIGIYARAFSAGGTVIDLNGRWDAPKFVAKCSTDAIDHTSLAPTQLHDLVAAKLTAPSSLKTVVVGGGRLLDELRAAALALGWPVLRSYGMTESASQIATEHLGGDTEGWLDILNSWELKSDANSNCLAFRGPAACTGWATRDETGWKWHMPRDGWIVSRDIVEFSSDKSRLRFVSRADDQLKILGELVSMESVRARFPLGTVVARPDARRGFTLIAIVENGQAADAEAAVAQYNSQVPGYEEIAGLEIVEQIPRTALGKVAFGKLSV